MRYIFNEKSNIFYKNITLLEFGSGEVYGPKCSNSKFQNHFVLRKVTNADFFHMWVIQKIDGDLG